MDKVREAVGLDKKAEEGQEPVSGQQGGSAAGEPFDAGNSKEATQAADRSKEQNAKPSEQK